MPDLRHFGFYPGHLPSGPWNAITDVPGVRVGHATLIQGDGRLTPGSGPVRTGVTVILPHAGNLFQQKARAAVFTLNGFGKAMGFEQVRELGLIEAPIALTNTLNIGRVFDALVTESLRHNPEIGISTGTVNIVVGETNDGYLNDIQGRHVHAEHVQAALRAASSGEVQQGAVGAGTGTVCMGWKGGIGSASRVLPQEAGGYRVGALVQSNFGAFEELTILGVPVGRLMGNPAAGREKDHDSHPASGGGSVMVVLATDAPLDARQLERLGARAGAGLARTGSHFAHGSGDFVIAFRAGGWVAHDPEKQGPAGESIAPNQAQVMNLLFSAVIESVEEAVLNSLCHAESMTGRDGNTVLALPVETVVELLKRYRAGLD